MLVQLQPVQISLMWENIRLSVIKAHNVSSNVEARYSNSLLKNLLSGKFQCWLVYKKEDEQRKIIAIGVTSIIRDNLFDVKNLHILSLYGMRVLTEDVAVETFEKLQKYARMNGCENIVMTTNIERVKELAKARGFHCDSFVYKTSV